MFSDLYIVEMTCYCSLFTLSVERLYRTFNLLDYSTDLYITDRLMRFKRLKVLRDKKNFKSAFGL